MSDREELMELRRLDELERKAAGTSYAPPQTPPEHVAPPFRMEAKTPANSRALPVFKAGLVEDPQTKLRVAAETMYPGDPRAMDRIGMIGGRMVTVNDAGELEYVADKWGEFGANLAANAPEMIGGTAGALSGMPVIGSTLGVMGARGLKRAGAGLAFDEPQTIGGNLKSIGKEGAINLATATVGKGLAGVANRGRQVDFTPANLAEAKALQADIKAKFGIDLNLAQASQDPKAIAMWRYLARYPSGTSSKTAGDFTESQAGQMDAAMDALLQKFGNGYPAEMLGKEATSTAKAAIQQARKELSDEVDPLYRAAYAAVPEVDRTTKEGAKILDYLKLPYFREAFGAGQKLRALETKSAANAKSRTVETLSNADPDAGTWNKATTIVDSTPTGAKRITSRMEEGLTKQTPDGKYTRVDQTADYDITRPSLEELDYTKRALDERIDALYQAGQRQRARALKVKRDEFVASLDALPNSEWQAARAAYQAGAKSRIEPLEKGVVGLLANIKDPKAATAAIKIMRDPNISGREILQAKGVILKQPNGAETWDGLTRQYLASAWNSAQKISQTGAEINPAGKMVQQVAGTPNQRAKLVAMLGQERGNLAMDLFDTFRKISTTEVRGSDTEFNSLISSAFKSPLARTAKAALSPRQTAMDAADRASMDRLTGLVAEAMTDPAKVRQLRAVVQMPASQKKLYLLGTILTGKTADAAVSRGGDQLPPSYTPR